MVFSQKLKILSFFLFHRNRQQESVLRPSRNKLAILDYKNTDLKKSKILCFPQEVSPLVLCQRRKICTLLLYFKLSVL